MHFKKFLHGWLLPLVLLFLDTLLPRVFEYCGERMVRLSVSVSHDRYSHAGNCSSLPSNTGLFLSTGNKNLFLFQRHLSPFDPWPLLLFRFSLVWRQSFAVEVSDLYFLSPSFSVSGRIIRDLRRVFRVGEGPIYLREALLSRINQIL